jgi:hypothetical protein
MVAQVLWVGSAALAKPAFLSNDLGSYIPINASALPDARSRGGVNGGEVLLARPVKPF